MKHALQFCGAAVLIVALSSFTFVDGGVLMGDKTPPPPPQPEAASRRDVMSQGLTETTVNILTYLAALTGYID